MRIFLIFIILSSYSVNAKEVRVFNRPLAPFVDKINPNYEAGDIEKSSESEEDRFPLKFDILSNQTGIKDQGERGSCAYFSAAAMIENAFMAKQGSNVNLSEEFLILITKKIKKWDTNDEASNAANNILAAKELGILLERDYPYHMSWFKKNLPCEKYKSTDTTAPKNCFSHDGIIKYNDHGIQSRLIKLKNLQLDQIYNHQTNIMNAIYTDGTGVLVSLPVHPDGWGGDLGYVTYNDKMRKECIETPDLCGGHSVLLVGFDRETRRFIFKNSWGKTWGKEGYGSLSFEYVVKYSDYYHYHAKLLSKVALPSDYASKIDVKFDNIGHRISEDMNGDKVVKMDGVFKGIRGNHLYFSSYLVTKVRPDEEISDTNMDMMMKDPLAPTDGQKSGLIMDSYSYIMPSVLPIEFSKVQNNSLVMKISKNDFEYAKSMNPLSDEFYLRVTAYYSSDEGFQIMKRDYVKID